jgi:Skp family chaperone for outer membrane proteins
MKTRMSNGLWMAAVAGTLFLAACSSAPEQTDTMDAAPESTIAAPEVNAFQTEQQDLAADLRNLQAEVNTKLNEVNAELERTDLAAEARTAAEATKAQLEETRTTLANELSNVEEATADTWSNVKAGADKASKDVKGLWDGVKDKVEEATETK